MLFCAALHHAAEGGHLDVVAKLVIAGCNVSRYDAQGMSPGHLAARHGYHQVMDKLLLAGFALDMQGGLTALHGSVGSTALHIAAQHGHQQVRTVPFSMPTPSPHPLSQMHRPSACASHLGMFRICPKAPPVFLFGTHQLHAWHIIPLTIAAGYPLGGIGPCVYILCQ